MRPAVVPPACPPPIPTPPTPNSVMSLRMFWRLNSASSRAATAPQLPTTPLDASYENPSLGVFLLNPAARALRGAAARGAAPGTTEWDGAPTADAREPAFERS